MTLNRRQALKGMSTGVFAATARRGMRQAKFVSPLGNKVEPMAQVKFHPTWESLQEYQAPEAVIEATRQVLAEFRHQPGG